jgi:Holliday junction DNA helicase RuvA
VIAFLTGRVAAKTPTHCLLDVAGVGYKVAMSTNSLSALPAEGDTVTVHTHLHVREDEMSLFGFESTAERELFEKLITVSGVGPKVALAALSSFTPAVLADGIVSGDVALVSTIPGVGNKTAQRIILDLKDKLDVLPGVAGSAAAPDATVAAEAREALLAMGFSTPEVATALKGYAGAAGDSQAMLKYALQRLGGGA